MNDLLNVETCEYCTKEVNGGSQKSKYIISNFEQGQDFNDNISDNIIPAGKTTQIDEMQEPNIFKENSQAKNQRKRKQIFSKLNCDDEDFGNTNKNDIATSSAEKVSKVQYENVPSENASNDLAKQQSNKTFTPTSTMQPIASKRAKTFKTRNSQVPYSSPPRPRKVSILSQESKRMITSDAPILRNSKWSGVVSNSVFKPMYLRPIYIPPDEPNVMLKFLECKKKVQRVDGLYDWVLWKETLREGVDLLSQDTRHERLSWLNKPKPRL